MNDNAIGLQTVNKCQVAYSLQVLHIAND